jgi:hypothetical protein
MFLVISFCIISLYLTFKIYKYHTLIKNLSNLTNQSYGRTLISSITTIIKTKYLSFLQMFQKNIIKISKNLYCIDVVLEGKKCSILINIKRGPQPSIYILDENDKDITHQFKSLIQSHFNIVQSTPSHFSKNQLKIYDSDNNLLKTIEKDDLIHF